MPDVPQKCLVSPTPPELAMCQIPNDKPANTESTCCNFGQPGLVITDDESPFAKIEQPATVKTSTDSAAQKAIKENDIEDAGIEQEGKANEKNELPATNKDLATQVTRWIKTNGQEAATAQEPNNQPLSRTNENQAPLKNINIQDTQKNLPRCEEHDRQTLKENIS